MVDIEQQLRHYGDALAENFGPAQIGGVIEAGDPGRAGSSDRHRLAFAGIAAGLLLAVAGAFVLSRGSDDTVITDEPEPTSTLPIPDDRSNGGEIGVLLPSDPSWLVLRSDEFEQEPGAGSGEVVVFDLDGSLVILTASETPGAMESTSFADAPPEAAYNRVTIYGGFEAWSLGLTGFDIDPAVLRSAADGIVRTEGGWSLPGADLVLSEPSSAHLGGTATAMDVAPRAEDGSIDRSRTVTINANPGTAGQLYRTLGEASSLGVTRAEVDMFGTTGFLIGESGEAGEGIGFAIAYRDGRLFEAQTTSQNVDLGALLSSLEPATEADLDRRLDEAEQIREAELAATLAEQEPIEVVELPRFLAAQPWTPDRVYDPSLWSDDDRALGQAMQEQVEVQSRLSWLQGFDRRSNPDPLDPEVFVTVTEVYSFHIAHGGDIDGAPISIGRFSGRVTGYEDYANLNVIDGDVAIAMRSTTLTADELAAFAATVVPKDESALTGLTPIDPAWSLVLDEASPYGDSATGPPSYNVLYGDGAGNEILVVVQKIPAAVVALELSWINEDPSTDLRIGDDGWLILETWYQETAEPIDRSEPPDTARYLRYDDDLGVLLTVWGDRPQAIEVLAQGLRQVDESTWRTTVEPSLTPFDPDLN